MKNTVILSSLILVGLTFTCSATTIIVKADGSGDYPTIQAAINDANEGDTIEIWPGTYTGPGNRDIDPNGKALTIRSTDPNDPDIVAATIIDCNGTRSEPHFGFQLGYDDTEDGNSVINGLTITKSYSRPAILCWGGSTTITNCIITDNFENGIRCSGNSTTITITNCIITDNFGSGIHCSVSSTTITNCIITDNFESGIRCGDKSTRISNCIITGNQSNGILLYSKNAIITNCLIKRNTRNGYGSGIRCYGSNCNWIIKNCVISENECGSYC